MFKNIGRKRVERLLFQGKCHEQTVYHFLRFCFVQISSHFSYRERSTPNNTASETPGRFQSFGITSSFNRKIRKEGKVEKKKKNRKKEKICSSTRETAATRFVSCLGTCYPPRHTGNPTLVSQITRERRKGRKWTKREIVCVPPRKTTVFPSSEKRRRITSRNRLTRARDVGEGRQSNIVARSRR